MAIYVGEGVTVLCAAKNPVTGGIVNTGTATVEFYAPGKNPAKNTADRTADHGPETMSFDATIPNIDGSSGAFVAFIDTTGWEAGKWAYKVTVDDAYPSWEYGSFKLDV